jgi:hypothetical protein
VNLTTVFKSQFLRLVRIPGALASIYSVVVMVWPHLTQTEQMLISGGALGVFEVGVHLVWPQIPTSWRNGILAQAAAKSLGGTVTVPPVAPPVAQINVPVTPPAP